MMPSVVFGSLLRQVWEPLSNQIKHMEVFISVDGPHKILQRAVVRPPLGYGHECNFGSRMLLLTLISGTIIYSFSLLNYLTLL